MSETLGKLLGIGFPAPIASKLAETGKTLSQIKRLSKDQQVQFGITQELKEKLGSRKPIPEATVNKLLYDSSRTCCVCRGAHSHAIVIHHITPWEETSDNSEENLVVLCLHCHGEAHTNRELSRNLTPDQIRYSKLKWINFVREKAEDRAKGITKIQNLLYWDFFNYSRIFSLIQDMGISLDSAVQSTVGWQLFIGGFIAENGSLDFSQWPDDIESKSHWTNFFEGLWISQYMININNLLFQYVNLKYINSDQSSRELLSNIDLGDFVLIQNTFFFKKTSEETSGPGQIRNVYVKKKDLEIKGIIDAWLCISMSSKIRLSGKKRSSVVGIVTGIDQNGGKFTIDLSILAIGQFLKPLVSLS